MKAAGCIAAILTGYTAISLGVLKVFWRQFGVHFYFSDHSHAPEAPFFLDVMLISLLIGAGLCLVILRAVIPATLTVLSVSFFEFLFLHSDRHDLAQTILFVGILVGQLITLYLHTILHSQDRRRKLAEHEFHA